MKFTNKELALLMQGLSFILEAAEAEVDGKKITIRDLAKYKEAVAFLNRTVGQNPPTHVGEVDQLFTRLVDHAEQSTQTGQKEPEQPYCQFLH